MTEAVPMETMIAGVTTVVTAAVGWISSFAEEIVSDPFLTLSCVAVPLAGFGIGAIRRLTRL